MLLVRVVRRVRYICARQKSNSFQRWSYAKGSMGFLLGAFWLSGFLAYCSGTRCGCRACFLMIPYPGFCLSSGWPDACEIDRLQAEREKTTEY